MTTKERITVGTVRLWRTLFVHVMSSLTIARCNITHGTIMTKTTYCDSARCGDVYIYSHRKQQPSSDRHIYVCTSSNGGGCQISFNDTVLLRLEIMVHILFYYNCTVTHMSGMILNEQTLYTIGVGTETFKRICVKIFHQQSRDDNFKICRWRKFSNVGIRRMPELQCCY